MAKKLWGGRFEKKTNPLVEEFTKSIDFDYKLAEYDVAGSLIHVNALEKSGFLKSSEAKKLTGALVVLYRKIKKGNFVPDKNCEDIHTNIQNILEKKIGSLALKLHTARSRNDQVLFDLKIFCKAALVETIGLCKGLKNSLNKAGMKNKTVVIPGFTHLQHAQLVYLSDYLTSYGEMLTRDIDRLAKAYGGIKLSLGTGALCGTPIKPKTYSTAIRNFFKKYADTTDFLKHDIIEPKSIDAISDRDFVIEVLSDLSILGMHLSRLAEDLIIWSTREFGFVEMDDAFATGSSLMPQKKNPDVLELVRGYTGTLYGNLVGVLTMMKGLPLSYNRDMQLDKPPLFSSFEIISKELVVLAKLIETLKWNKKCIEKRIEEDETLYATDLAYYLVKKGVPFKKAHEAIGRLINEALKKGKRIKEMPDKELKKFSDKLKHKDIVRIMKPLESVKSRISVDR